MIGWALRQVVIWVGLATVVLAAYGYRGEFLGMIGRSGGDTAAAPGGRPVATSVARDTARSAGSRSMAIRAGHGGHFVVDAEVDGVTVRFLVDTGATRVVLTPEDAKRIGFHLRDRSFTERHRTAGGIVRAAPVTLREVRIGQLTVRDVDASVNEQPIGISLLGMTFLNRLDGYRVQGDRLILDW
jgi:aspartyl protease family protein